MCSWWCCVSSVSADSLFSSLGLGAVVGLGMAGLLLLLVLVDISCFFLRQCGLLMCITRKLCSKKTATSGKSKEMEEGKAAYLWVSLNDLCFVLNNSVLCPCSLIYALTAFFLSALKVVDLLFIWIFAWISSFHPIIQSPLFYSIYFASFSFSCSALLSDRK